MVWRTPASERGTTIRRPFEAEATLSWLDHREFWDCMKPHGHEWPIASLRHLRTLRVSPAQAGRFFRSTQRLPLGGADPFLRLDAGHQRADPTSAESELRFRVWP